MSKKAETQPAKKDMSAARGKRAENVRTKQEALTTQVQAILADSRINDELKRKLAYAQEVISGERPGDVSLMTQVRDQYMREVRRRIM